MFFTADLIDRDIRATPIGVKLVEVEKTGQQPPNDIREIRTVAEFPAKLYPRGAVEAQADVDKTGDYVLYFLIGDAIEEDDKFRVPLEVGVAPAGAQPPLVLIGGSVGGLLLAGFGVWFFLRKRKPSPPSEGQEN